MREFLNLGVSISAYCIKFLRNFRMNTFQIILLIIEFSSLFNKILIFYMKISRLIGNVTVLGSREGLALLGVAVVYKLDSPLVAMEHLCHHTLS
jgi:hypothetical protein